MDATRPRRTHDPIRQTWYALSRQRRLAFHMHYITAVELEILSHERGKTWLAHIGGRPDPH